MQLPPAIQKGDKVILLATSGQIDPDLSTKAAQNLRDLGYIVDVFSTALSSFHYFSGTVESRLEQFQQAISDPDCKAILCARGGFGAIHLLDKLDWTTFKTYPKWLIGFSDITLLHAAIQQEGFASIHGPMAKEFAQLSTDAKAVLQYASGNFSTLQWHGNHLKTGVIEGELIGGNLSMLTSIIGSSWEPEWDGKILFLEDIGEYLYKLDRMLWTLKLRGVFDKIGGLIIGQMTDISNTKVPYGKSFPEILQSIILPYSFPVAMNLESGHDEPNHPLVLGAKVKLEIDKIEAKLTYLV